MFRVVVRFLGRFVYAELHSGQSPAGVLNVLAANMQFNPEIRAGRHQFALSIPRSALLQSGSRPPDLMIASQEAADSAEHGVWLLNDHDVLFEGEQTFNWSKRVDPTLVDLASLSQGATLDPSAVFARGAAIARVYLPVGSGEAKQIIKGKQVEFVTLSDQNTSVRAAMALADLVEVTIDLPDAARRLPIFVKSRSGGPTGAIVVKVFRDEPTILTFTNLCPLPHTAVDEEFAGLYEVLQAPPISADRLVPKEAVRLGHLDDCYNKAYIAYEA